MSLRINTNISALNSHSNLVKNDSRQSNAIERLSSGLRINRAADDAAGLTISEKLRTQVRGINRSILNVQDGMSLIQTAEGALNEVQNMLQRMRELALQSSNDTLTTQDRLEIQKEVAQLKDEIDRISYTTEFNTKRLLDGTGTASITTTDKKSMDGVVVDTVLTFSDFSVVIWPKAEQIPGEGLVIHEGRAEKQRSHIFTTVDGGKVDNTTRLESIANFYDNNGHFILDIPQTLYVQGDNAQGKITVSKDLTLPQLTDRLLEGMTSDQLGNGLKFEGSTATFYTDGINAGQITVSSGKNGDLGRINFTGEQDLIYALGFEQVVAPVDPIYSIAVTNIGLPAAERLTNTTQVAGHRASGLIQGIDLMFEPPRSAHVDTRPSELGISIPVDPGAPAEASAAITFRVSDADNNTADADIEIPAGTFSMNQISSIINDQLSFDGGPRIRARINGDNAVEFYSFDTGTAAYVSIAGVNITNNVLGISTGRYTGTGGNPGMATSFDIIEEFGFDSRPTRFSIEDRHGLSAVITLDGNYSVGGLNSLVQAINLQMGELEIVAENANGLLRLRSIETGLLSNFEITDLHDDLPPGDNPSPINTVLRLNEQNTITGTDGSAVSQNFAYDVPSTKWGYVVADQGVAVADGLPGPDNLSFYIADLDGNGMTITITAGSTTAAGVNTSQTFRSLNEIASIINTQAGIDQIKVNARIIDDNNSLRLFSTIPGRDGKVVLAELGVPSPNSLQSIFGVRPIAYENGVGNHEYKLHVKDTSVQFQIGPNEGHVAHSNIIRTDVKALGIEDLDLTTVGSSQRAIGLVDKALQKISSERAKLGAIENRMNYTSNSLRVALQNMTASESRIRDVDMASEVIEMTQSQILQQASNAMISQANVKAQSVLELIR